MPILRSAGAPILPRHSFLCGLVLCALPLVTGTGTAFFDLASFSSVSVRTGQNAPTNIDSVLIESEVGHGVARTLVTIRLTLGLFCIFTAANPDSCRAIDSIETTCAFSLPLDMAVTNLYWWINGVRQIAWIQDRALASAQYESTVNRRRDPALLEYVGPGQYRLSLFTSSRAETRIAAIEFQHTFDASNDSAFAVLPVCCNCFPRYTLSGQVKALSPLIGFMRAVLSCRDSGEYAFSMPGLGQGTFMRERPLDLRASGVDTLFPAVVATARGAHDSGEFIWCGLDKDRQEIFGFTMLLDHARLKAIAEPRTIVFVVDIRQDGLAAAKKLAVLSLHNYLDDHCRFNVIISGNSEDSTHAAFDAPAPVTVENLKSACDLIAQMKADGTSSTSAGLKKAIAQAMGQTMMLISDFAGDSASPLAKEIGALVLASGCMLSVVSSSSFLSTLAASTGGKRIAALDENQFFPFWVYYSPDGAKHYEPRLPELAQATNAAAGITDLEITPIEGASDVVYSTVTRGDSTLLLVAGKTTIPCGTVRLVIAGKIDGLKFVTETEGAFCVTATDEMLQTVLGAFREANYLNAKDAAGNTDAVRVLGLSNNFVYAQTSLIALEPGEALWRNTGTATIELTAAPVHFAPIFILSGADVRSLQTASAGVHAIPAGPPANPELYYNPEAEQNPAFVVISGDTLKNVSLENLIAGNLTCPVLSKGTVSHDLTRVFVKYGRSIVTFRLPRVKPGTTALLRLFTAQGRITVSAVVRMTGALVVEWDSRSTAKACLGFCIAQIIVDGKKYQAPFIITGR
jgi:hypothetical protein